MRAPLYASPEFPNCNPDLHAGFIDPALWPDVEDAFGDGPAEVVDELPDLALSEAEIEVVGEPPETPRESMIRLVAAASRGSTEHDEDVDDGLDVFSSLSIPTLPPIDLSLASAIVETDIDVVAEPEAQTVDAVEREVAKVVEVDAQLASIEHAEPPPAPAVHVGAIVIHIPEPEVEVPAPRETPSSSDAFVRLVEGIVAASEAIVTVDAVVELLSGRPVPSVLFGSTKVELSNLVARDDAQNLVLAAHVAKAAKEWALIVRDEGGDFDACGGKTLDEFAAEIAAGLVGDPARAEPLRRSLRSRGIAAYGLVDAA